MFFKHAKIKGFDRNEFEKKGINYLKLHLEREGYHKLPKYVFDPVYHEAVQKLLSLAVQFPVSDDEIPF